MKVMEGLRTPRPPILENGLSDLIWDIMDDCWRQKPEDRLSAAGVIQRLPLASAVDNRPTGNWDDLAPLDFRSAFQEQATQTARDTLEEILSLDTSPS